jgi:predicted RND superfamily exporter protein
VSDHFVVRARWIILALLVALCAWILPGAAHIQEDDDVLAFLPPDHPDVIAFREVADRFGVLEIGLVGLHKPDGGELLSLERADEVRGLSQKLGDLPGVRMVLSFTNLPDPKATDEGLEVAELVPANLRDPAKIREKVLASRDAVGNMISKDGTAAALLVFLVHGSDTPKATTLQQIRDVVATRTGTASTTSAGRRSSRTRRPARAARTSTGCRRWSSACWWWCRRCCSAA